MCDQRDVGSSAKMFLVIMNGFICDYLRFYDCDCVVCGLSTGEVRAPGKVSFCLGDVLNFLVYSLVTNGEAF